MNALCAVIRPMSSVLRPVSSKHCFGRLPISCSPYTAAQSCSSGTPPRQKERILLDDAENGFGFIRSNAQPAKPRSTSVTEVRGPYYSAYGKRHLQDLLETMGYHIDGLKFAGGSFSLMPEAAVREVVDIAHRYGVYVSTGG